MLAPQHICMILIKKSYNLFIHNKHLNSSTFCRKLFLYITSSLGLLDEATVAAPTAAAPTAAAPTVAIAALPATDDET